MNVYHSFKLEGRIAFTLISLNLCISRAPFRNANLELESLDNMSSAIYFSRHFLKIIFT